MKPRIADVQIEISYTLICVAAVCLILNILDGMIWCTLAVIIHESGHLMAMLKCGYAPEKIKIAAFEIKIFDSKRQCRSEKQNFFIN